MAGGDCDAGEDPQVSGGRGIRAPGAAHHDWGLGQLGLAGSVTWRRDLRARQWDAVAPLGPAPLPLPPELREPRSCFWVRVAQGFLWPGIEKRLGLCHGLARWGLGPRWSISVELSLLGVRSEDPSWCPLFSSALGKFGLRICSRHLLSG